MQTATEILQDPRIGATVAGTTVSAHWWAVSGWGDVAAILGAVLSLTLIGVNILYARKVYLEWKILRRREAERDVD